MPPSATDLAPSDAVRLASLVVTYHRPEPLRRTLVALTGQSRSPESILVFDNGRDPATEAVVKSFADRGARYHAPGGNVGTAGALNDGLGLLAAEGFDLIHYTGDGEAPEPRTLLADRVAAFVDLDPTEVGCIASHGKRWDWRDGSRRSVPLDELEPGALVDVDVISATQPIFSRHCILAGGLPTREIFWGFVDYQQSLQIRRLGLRILVDADSARVERQARGETRRSRVSRLVPQLPYDTLWRRYYLTRNIVYSMRSVFGRPDLARKEVVKQLAVTPFALARGPRYAWRRALLVVQAAVDGYRGRLGPRFLPQLVDGRYEEAFLRRPEPAADGPGE